MKLMFIAALTLTLIVCACQSQQTPDPRIAQLGSQVSMLKSQNADLQRQKADLQNRMADLQKQRDTCTAKFERSTVLYDVGLFNNETRAWVIPADVEPILAQNKRGTYAHYDPKTQVETVHFKGKP
jgi:Tfp pilus assembly protein PilN